jgi:DNA-directed RNA polymerase subunit RPC12/RpoP
MSDFYKCHKCGSNEFTHDLTEMYEELFYSEEGKIREGHRYTGATAWRCKECSAEIPEEDSQKFLLMVYDAYP